MSVDALCVFHLSTLEYGHLCFLCTDGAKAEANATEVDLEVKKVKAATKIQAIFRGHNERRKYLKDKQNVVKIEALARGFLTRKNVTGMKG